MRCRIYRWMLSRSQAAGGPLPDRLRDHVARCERCRRHHEALEALAEGLRSSAPPVEALPEGLAARIMEAVGGPASGSAPLRPARRALRAAPLAVALAAAACVVAFVAIYALNPWRPHSDGDGGPRPVAPVGLMPRALPAPRDLTEPLWRDIQQLTTTPVRDEVQRLAADTRHIGRSLLARLPLSLLGGEQWIDGLLDGAGLAGNGATSAPARRAGG